MACHFHSRRLPVPLLREPFVPPPSESVVKQSRAWFETQSLWELRPAGGVRNPGTIPPADRAGKRWASSKSRYSPTNSPPPGSCPVCRLGRSTAGRHLRNAFPVSENRCHPRSTPPPQSVSPWLAALPAAPAQAFLRHSRARPQPGGVATGACGEHCLAPSAQPSARHSCALRATTMPCSSSSTVRAGRRAPEELLHGIVV